VLRNRTRRQLETFQYFTLPEDAVMTGLWLSNTLSDPEMYEFQVAPRGAAQQVYQEQVRINVDPALLESVGPRQYRLRVFPVLVSEPMVVTMTYKTMPDREGNWPLPSLQEQRNIFWDKDTIRTINGVTLNVAADSMWLPAQLSSGHTSLDYQQQHLGYIDAGSYYYAEPLPMLNTRLLNDRVALLIDGSYSMGSHRDELRQSIKQLPGAEVFFCQKKCSRSNAESQRTWQFYGNTQPLQQFAAFETGFTLSEYDAVFMLSDAGSYESQVESTKLVLNRPTWLIEHGNTAKAYRDELVDSIRQSGGDVVFSVQQALMQMAGKSKINKLLAVTSSHQWYERPAGADDTSNENLAEIVSALRVEQLSQSGQSLQSLDSLHDIAIEHGIVTPYSSMIVLVNDRQRDRLEELSNENDRFEREVEQGKQPAPRRRVANAVPEPHEYALMLIAIILLLLTAHRQGWTPTRIIHGNHGISFDL